MAKAILNFSGASNIIDPLEGLRNSLQQTSSSLGQIRVQDEARARQARLDALATPGSPEWRSAKEAEKNLKIDTMAAEQNWKKEFDDVYKNAIKSSNQSVVGSPEHAEAQKVLAELAKNKQISELEVNAKYNPLMRSQLEELRRQEKERSQGEVAAGAIIDAERPKYKETTVTPEDVEGARVALAKNYEAQTKAQKTAWERRVAKEIENLKNIPTEEAVSFGAGEVVMMPTGTPMSEEEMRLEAIRRVGELPETTGPDESLLPRVGTTRTEVERTQEELVQAKIDAVLRARDEGKISNVLAMQSISALNKGLTPEQIIARDKLNLQKEEFEEKKSQNYYGKSSGKGGKGWLSTLNQVYKDYGSPDRWFGTGKQASLEKALNEIQIEGEYTDGEMNDAINAARSTYANIGGVGVDSVKFPAAVSDYLLRVAKPKDKK